MRKWKYPTKDRRSHILKLATPIILGMLSINILDFCISLLSLKLLNILKVTLLFKAYRYKILTKSALCMSRKSLFPRTDLWSNFSNF